MKKLLLTTLLVAGVLLSCFAQKPHMVVFYNLENLWADAKLTTIPDID